MLCKKCKICRRLGQKTFLKGEKCSSPKCALVKRPFPPGPPKKKRGGSFSEYAKELREKQKLQKHYGLREGQFRRYVKNVLHKRGRVADASVLLLNQLESRLDNIVFRLGLAKSRREARQLVTHGHFLVNSKPVNVPSFEVKKEAVVALKPTKKIKTIFKIQEPVLKNYQPPAWLSLDKANLSGKVIAEPMVEEIKSSVDVSSIFEFYSR